MGEKNKNLSQVGRFSGDEVVVPDLYEAEQAQAEIQERIHGLRADIFSKLSQYFDPSDLQNKIAWAVFDLTKDGQAADSDISAPREKRLLVMVVPSYGEEVIDGHQVPTLRMWTNERYVSPDEQTSQWLGVDITIDSNNYVMHSVDAVEENANGQSHGVVMFMVDDDGDLARSPNMNVLTTPLKSALLTQPDGYRQERFPFGDYGANYHPEAALDAAEQLVWEMQYLEPIGHTQRL